MNPIFRQGDGGGIGYSIGDLHERFDAVCLEHVNAGRAKAFALIFCNFNDIDLNHILNDRGAFAQLDRLSGNRLSVFYLDSDSKTVTEYFNSRYLGKLGIAGEASLPCIVFFKIRDRKMSDIQIKRLDSADLMHGFHELYTTIESYLKTLA